MTVRDAHWPMRTRTMRKAATIAEPTTRNDDDPVSLRASGEVCPHCHAACGAPNLLTSMTRYYTCGQCAARWQVARNWQIVTESKER